MHLRWGCYDVSLEYGFTRIWVVRGEGALVEPKRLLLWLSISMEAATRRHEAVGVNACLLMRLRTRVGRTRAERTDHWRHLYCGIGGKSLFLALIRSRVRDWRFNLALACIWVGRDHLAKSSWFTLACVRPFLSFWLRHRYHFNWLSSWLFLYLSSRFLLLNVKSF
jgi:hypothetical protein